MDDLHGLPDRPRPLRRPGGAARDLPPRRPGAQAAPRLAFDLFETGPAESPGWVWIPAFRAFTPNSRSDPGAVLAKKGYRPELVAAPLGAALARTPAEARALAAIRLRAGASDLRDLRLVPSPVASPSIRSPRRRPVSPGPLGRCGRRRADPGPDCRPLLGARRPFTRPGVRYSSGPPAWIPSSCTDRARVSAQEISRFSASGFAFPFHRA